MEKRLAYRLINQDEITHSEIQDFENGQEVPFVKEVGLFKLKTGDFQFTTEGDFKTILSGYDYILVKSRIANLLTENAPEHLRSRPVKIFRKATGEEWLDYSEIEIKNEIEFWKYFETDCPGISVYHMMNSMILISPELKTIIEDYIDEETRIKLKQELPIMGG